MARHLRVFVGALLLLVLIAPAWSQQLKATVATEKDTAGKYTGNYVLSVTLEGAPTARQVSFAIGFPTAYGVNAAADDIRVVAVKPGVDVYLIDANTPETPADTSDDTPVLFAEPTADASTNTVWVVALLKEEASKSDAAKTKVCDIVFTSRGRATTAQVAFDAANASVKDGSLNVISAPPAFSGTNQPKLGDLNWDDLVTTKDFGFWLQAFRQGGDLPFADIFPLASGSLSDPANAISKGNDGITTKDFGAWLQAWRALSTTGAAPAAAEGGL